MQVLNKFGGDAEAVEALVCKTSLSGFESHRYLQKFLKKALAKYPISDLGEWTWVLVRSEYWKRALLTQTLDPGIPALTDPAARATFFDEALVAEASGRMSELMTVWHMGRESL
jgi:hypothetical protein